MTGPALPPLVAILGPTASGKSALAIYLARQLNGEVIPCDSTQLYRGFDIGTGKPTPEERRGVPHHLLDVLNPDQAATAGGYREMAIAVLRDLRERQKLPVLTIGTGLYMRALFDGLADLPQRSEDLRARLRVSVEKHGQPHLHRLLQWLDPQSAQRIAPADTQKLMRAVEVCLLARRPLTEVHRAGRIPLTGWQILKIGLEPPRDQLYARIHTRIDAMLAKGWQAEVDKLISAVDLNNQAALGGVTERHRKDEIPPVPGNSADGAPPGSLTGALKPFDFIGYRELAAVARHQMSLDAARAAIQQATRRYAKRQLTWFRREASVEWFSGFGDNPGIQTAALEWLRRNGGGARLTPGP